jgi:hypothetical protein
MAFIEAGRPAARFNASAIRVVTITLTQARRDNLCADADLFFRERDAPKIRKSFLYGSFKDLPFGEPEKILVPAFRRPGSNKPFPLFPTIAETADR